MSDDKTVEVTPKDEENAVLLLDAAEALDLEPNVVLTTSDGFLVPESVAKKAGVEYDAGDDDEVSFKTKAEAEEYADEHGLDVDKSLKADEYKAAVAAEANKGA